MEDAPSSSTSEKLLTKIEHEAKLRSDLKRAVEAKDEGNAFFKEKLYTKAVRKYHMSLLIARGMQVYGAKSNANLSSNAICAISGETGQDENMPPDVRMTIQDIVVKCYNNLAACIIFREDVTEKDYERAITHCNRVLSDENANADQKEKANYRKGFALKLLKDYDGALVYFEKCSEKNKEAKIKASECREMARKDRCDRDKKIRQNFIRVEERRNAQLHQQAAEALQNQAEVNNEVHNGIIMNGDAFAH